VAIPFVFIVIDLFLLPDGAALFVTEEVMAAFDGEQ